MGKLRIRGASVGRLDRFLREIAKDRPAAAQNAKVALGLMFALAVRRGALTTNPARETGRIRRPRRTVRALEAEHLEGVRAAIRQWQQPTPGKPGPRHTGDPADVVDLMLATGVRIGEVLAVRWEDVDPGAEHPTVTICGTIGLFEGQGRLQTGVDEIRRRLPDRCPSPVRGRDADGPQAHRCRQPP